MSAGSVAGGLSRDGSLGLNATVASPASSGGRRSSESSRPLLVISLGRALHLPPYDGDSELEIRRVPAFPAPGTLDPTRPTVIVLDRLLLQSVGRDTPSITAAAQTAAIIGIGDPEDADPPSHFPVELLCGFIAGGSTPGSVAVQLRGAFRHAVSMVAERAARRQAQERYHELTELTRVGVALSTERDLLSLLEMILGQSRRITSADAGSIYLAERRENGEPASTLRFKLSQNHTLPNLPFSEFTVPIDQTSLAGYAAATGEPLVISDVYLLPGDVEYRQNRSFDEKFGYRTKSMLVLPMKTHRDEVVGVLQLINRKRSPDDRLGSNEAVEQSVLSFDQRSVELVNALASQAAVAIENSLLYENIERLFEGFVTAAVTAIETRDPTTFGHSGRVATMSVRLAEAVDRGGEGPYRGTTFTREQLRELRYAGLLHDFGKVGVREQVLVKEKKLYDADLALIRHRFDFLIQGAELQFERARAQYLLENGRSGYEKTLREIERARLERRAELDRFFAAIMAANEPTVVAESSFEELEALARRTYVDINGVEHPLLREEELRFLTIARGNLDEIERREIESHVTNTFRFLQQIPWTRELRNVPEIAYGHHEKLNGQGYPRAVSGAAISVQTRVMTIADIFDALTASDRPYKRAVSVTEALDMLRDEAKQGLLDEHLLGTFVQARIFAQSEGPAGA